MKNVFNQEASPALIILGRVIKCAQPTRITLATSPTDLEAVYRLRYQTVVERGWAQPADYPDGMEQDSYDSRSLQIVGWEGSVLTATARLVLPTPGHVLPIEESFAIQIEPREQVIEVGRTIVTHTNSRQRHHLFMALMAQATIEARMRGFTHFCGAHTPPMIRLYRMLGVPLVVVGSAKQSWGEKRYPVVHNFEDEEALLAISERWYKMVSQL